MFVFTPPYSSYCWSHAFVPSLFRLSKTMPENHQHMWKWHKIKNLPPCVPRLSSITPISTPPTPPTPTFLHLLTLMVVFSQTPGQFVATESDQNNNNWGWVLVRAIKNAKVSLDWMMVKDKHLKSVSSAWDYTEGICFYTKHECGTGCGGVRVWEGTVRGFFGWVSVGDGGGGDDTFYLCFMGRVV